MYKKGKDYMYRYILILLLITVELFALNVKLKAKQSGDIVKVKVLVKNIMYGKIEAKKKGVAPNYIKRIIAHVGGEIVYDVSLSPSWQRNPSIKFQYKYRHRSDTIELTIIDNNDKKNVQSFKIKKSMFKNKNSQKAVVFTNDKILATSPWDIKETHTAISQLYNTSKFVKEKIDIFTSFTGDYHPNTHIIGIHSDVKLKSIAVFANIGERPALVAVFRISKDAIIDYRFNLKMYSYSGPGTVITVVGEGYDGTFYKSISYLSLGYDKDRFIKGCEKQSNDLDANTCKDIANEISLQKLGNYYHTLMRTNYLPASRKLLLEQSSWLQKREKVCPKFDANCLSNYYQERMSILKKTYAKKSSNLRFDRDITCESFNGTVFSNNLDVYAGGSYRGKGVNYQIEDSSHQTTEFEVIVNSPDKPVALILGAYDPSVWNIKWTKGTKIEAVLAYGQHKQFVAGLPKGTPILAGNDNRSCDLSNNVGSDFDQDTILLYQERKNKLSKQMYNKTITSMRQAKNGKLLFGDKISINTKLYSSKDTPTSSFIDKTESLYGDEGLNKLLKEGKIRLLKTTELNKWVKAGYMILDKISLPVNAHAIYILKKGTPYPDISAGDEPTIYDLNTMICNGSGCRNY